MEKMTVKEYADFKGVSVQAVYKKIENNKLKTIEEKKDRRYITFIIIDEEPEQEQPEVKEIKETEKEEIQPISTGNSISTPTNSTTEFQPISTEKTGNSTSTATNSTTEFQPNTNNELNQAIVDLLREQLQEKDKQIERLLKTNEEQLARLTELLYRSQQLEKLLSSKVSEDKPLQEEPIIDIETEEQPERKRSFLNRFFKRKKGE